MPVNFGLLTPQVPQPQHGAVQQSQNQSLSLGQLAGLVGDAFNKMSSPQQSHTSAIPAYAQGNTQGLLATQQPGSIQAAPQASPLLANPQQPGSIAPQGKYNIQDAIKAAQATYPDNPVMAQLASAQAIEESRLNGKPSGLAVNHNNFFGIKGEGSAGSVTMPTHEFVNGHMITIPQQFAAYKTPEDGFAAHKKLMGNSRYSKVWQAGNIQDAATAVQQAGYATDPGYATNLVNTYNQYVGS